MDILLDKTGDIKLSPDGDILLTNSVTQSIMIRLKWLEGEWRWRREEGLPYFNNLLIKNPDTDYFESEVREKIFEVEEVTDVKDVSIVFDSRTRQATIQFTAVTDFETIKEEVTISCQNMG